MKLFRNALFVAAMLLISIIARGQSISQYNETASAGPNNTVNYSYTVTWYYPSPSNPFYSGMNTYAKVFGHFETPTGNVPLNDLTLHQQTFGGNFSGNKSFSNNVDIAYTVASQKPANATAFTYHIRINSTVYWGNPQQFISDSWTSQEMTYYY